MSQPAVGSEEWKQQDKGPSSLVICWVISSLSAVFVLGRIFVRAKIQGKLLSDDYFTLLGQTCSFISVGLSTAAVASGNGKHFTLLTTEQQQSAILWTTAAFCPGVLSFGLPKLAVISLLTRLLNPSRAHKAFLWFLGIWNQLTLFATVGVLLGRCTPARSLWDFSVEGTCFDTSILVGYCIYAGSYSAFVDIYLAFYPTVVLFKLQLPTKKKIALCIALGIGLISGIVAIYKTTRIPSLGSADFSYDTSDLVIWTVIEGSTLIIACSIPVLQPLLELILRRNPFSSAKDSKHYPRYYEDYSESRSRNIELGHRRAKSKVRDDLGLTVAADDDSQENILKPLEKGAPVPSLGRRPSQAGMEGNIMRTDAITVTYEARPDVDDKANHMNSSRW